MYLGIQGLMPEDLREVDDTTVKKIRDSGFSGVACRYFAPDDATKPEVLRLRDVLNSGGIDPCQTVAQHADIISSDEQERRSGIKSMQKMCEVSSWLNAGNLYLRPGSVNPNGSWWAHPENFKKETFETLVESIREICRAAEHFDVMLAVEGHTLSILDSPEVILDLISRVDSPKLGFNMDPVNFIGSVRDAYSNTVVQDKLYEVLGNHIVCGHAKDFFIEERLVLHIEETVIGEGILDQRTFLSGFEKYCPDGYVQIEHLPEEQIPLARKSLYETGVQCGITWKGLDE